MLIMLPPHQANVQVMSILRRIPFYNIYHRSVERPLHRDSH